MVVTYLVYHVASQQRSLVICSSNCRAISCAKCLRARPSLLFIVVPHLLQYQYQYQRQYVCTQFVLV